MRRLVNVFHERTFAILTPIVQMGQMRVPVNPFELVMIGSFDVTMECAFENLGFVTAWTIVEIIA